MWKPRNCVALDAHVHVILGTQTCPQITPIRPHEIGCAAMPMPCPYLPTPTHEFLVPKHVDGLPRFRQSSGVHELSWAVRRNLGQPQSPTKLDCHTQSWMPNDCQPWLPMIYAWTSTSNLWVVMRYTWMSTHVKCTPMYYSRTPTYCSWKPT